MIYTFGYQGRKLDEMIGLVRTLDATLVDVRFNPHTSNPDWHRDTLRHRLGDHYRHVKELGNEAYRTPTIRIVDLEAGLARVLSAAGHGDVILLCACRAYSSCHRATIARALAERGHAVSEITHLDPFRSARRELQPALNLVE